METPANLARSRTKIVATIGPACRSPEMMAQLVRAGADLFRLTRGPSDRQDAGAAAL